MSLLKLPPEQLSAWPAGICQLPPESYRLTKLPSRSHCHCLHESWCPPVGQWSPQMGLCPPPHPVYPSSVTLNVSKQQPAPVPQTEDAEKQPSCPLGKTPTGSKLGGMQIYPSIPAASNWEQLQGGVESSSTPGDWFQNPSHALKWAQLPGITQPHKPFWWKRSPSEFKDVFKSW